MLLKRRAFGLQILCCISHAGMVRAQPLSRRTGDWFCTTPDPPPHIGLTIQNYAASTDTDLTTLAKIKTDFKLTDYGTQLLDERWRSSDGLTPNSGQITLGVAFLENNPVKANIVRTIAPHWLDGPTIGSLDTSLRNRVAFAFDVPPDKAQIRVRFDPSLGNNSQVGRINLRVPKGQHTMNLQDLEDYIVLHEFGHTLGLQHEQASPVSNIIWDEDAVIADLSKPPTNWSAEYIRKTVINKFSTSYACIGDQGFNTQSIMLYQIPSNWTKNHFITPLNTRISDRDFKCLAAVYRA